MHPCRLSATTAPAQEACRTHQLTPAHCSGLAGAALVLGPGAAMSRPPAGGTAKNAPAVSGRRHAVGALSCNLVGQRYLLQLPQCKASHAAGSYLAQSAGVPCAQTHQHGGAAAAWVVVGAWNVGGS
jgi:hypothetical protein